MQYFPPISSKVVVTQWKFPAHDRFKLNLDGCSKGNLGQTKGRCVLRDDKGRLMWGIANHYKISTNMMAEVKALLQGVQHCWELGIIELDANLTLKF